MSFFSFIFALRVVVGNISHALSKVRARVGVVEGEALHEAALNCGSVVLVVSTAARAANKEINRINCFSRLHVISKSANAAVVVAPPLFHSLSHWVSPRLWQVAPSHCLGQIRLRPATSLVIGIQTLNAPHIINFRHFGIEHILKSEPVRYSACFNIRPYYYYCFFVQIFCVLLLRITKMLEICLATFLLPPKSCMLKILSLY